MSLSTASATPSPQLGRRGMGRSLASGPSRACPAGGTGWPRPSTGSSRSGRLRPAKGEPHGPAGRAKARRWRPVHREETDVRLVVTGGAGFIGSNFVRYMLRRYDDLEVVNLDKLTYAGNLENLRDVEDDPRYTFVNGDICDAVVVGEALRGADDDGVADVTIHER